MEKRHAELLWDRSSVNNLHSRFSEALVSAYTDYIDIEISLHHLEIGNQPQFPVTPTAILAP